MAEQVHLNIPGARFHNVLSWDDKTVDKLVNKAVELAVKVGVQLEEDASGVYLQEAETKGARIDWDNKAVLFSRKQIEQTIEVLRRSDPVPDPLRPLAVCDFMGIGPMSVAGMSSPVTTAGLAVTAVAEILVGLTFFNITRPGFDLKTVVCTGSLDMTNARVNFFGMHTHLNNIAA